MEVWDLGCWVGACCGVDSLLFCVFWNVEYFVDGVVDGIDDGVYIVWFFLSGFDGLRCQG